MIRAVLLDLDDTLYPYAPCNPAGLAAARELLAESIDVSEERFQAVHDEVRRELAERLRGQAASHNRALFFKRMVEVLVGAHRSGFAVELFDTYWRAFFDAMRPAPFAHDVLAALAADYKLALVSNHTTDIQLRKVDRLEFDRYLDAVVTSEEVGVEKPDPRVFQSAMDAVGVDASEVIMVGDDPVRDIGGARSLGIRTVWTREFAKHRTPSVAADRTIDGLAELPEVVRSFSE